MLVVVEVIVVVRVVVPDVEVEVLETTLPVVLSASSSPVAHFNRREPFLGVHPVSVDEQFELEGQTSTGSRQ